MTFKEALDIDVKTQENNINAVKEISNRVQSKDDQLKMKAVADSLEKMKQNAIARKKQEEIQKKNKPIQQGEQTTSQISNNTSNNAQSSNTNTTAQLGLGV